MRYYKNNGVTTLSADIDSSTTIVPVVSAAALPSSFPYDIRVGSEIMSVTSASSNNLTVVRGQESSGSAAHTSGDQVANIITAGALDEIQSAVGGGGTGPSLENGLRISVSSTDDCPVDGYSSGYIYVVPRRPIIDLVVDGSQTRCTVSSSTTINVSAWSAGVPCDVFAYWDAATSSVKFDVLAWTNGSTRATSLDRSVPGAAYKNGDFTRRYIGCFVKTFSTIYDSYQHRTISNFDNREPRPVMSKTNFTSSSISSSTGAVYSTNYSPTVLCGDVGRNALDLSFRIQALCNTATVTGYLGIGANSTSTFSSDALVAVLRSGVAGAYKDVETRINTPQLGYNTYNAIAYVSENLQVTAQGGAAATRYGWQGTVMG